MRHISEWLADWFKPKAPPPIPAETPLPAERSNPWRIYSERKGRLERFNLTPDEYQRQCRRIADDLGI